MMIGALGNKAVWMYSIIHVWDFGKRHAGSVVNVMKPDGAMP